MRQPTLTKNCLSMNCLSMNCQNLNSNASEINVVTNKKLLKNV